MSTNNSMKDLLKWADYPLSHSDLAWRKSHPCIDAGWLVKLGNVRKSYKKRYFKIIGRTLYYYKKTDSATPLGSINLEGGDVKERTNPESNTNGFFFEFTPSAKVQRSHSRFARSIMLKSLTARNRSEWMESLSRCTLSASNTMLLAAQSIYTFRGVGLGGRLSKERSCGFIWVVCESMVLF